MPRWKFLLARITRALWFRSALYSLAGVATALASMWLSPFIPDDLGAEIGADAVDNILGILASSMLAVTTFSLNIMVGAYSSATNNATPRATRLLIADPTSQNVLATFVGVFLFSIVGIIALSTGAYGQEGRVILFGVTIIVLIVIVVTLLRWIDHLSKLGRVGDTARRVEHNALEVMKENCAHPYSGCRPLSGFDDRGAVRFHAPTIGYIQHIDYSDLQGLAERADCRIAVLHDVGSFCDPSQPIIAVDRNSDDIRAEALLACITIGDERSFDQDPRFALSVLAEIGSTALSAATNDIGTAIDVTGRSLRVMACRARPELGDEIINDRVYAEMVTADDLFDDMFTSIARDGAGEVEVLLRLTKTLISLHDLGDDAYRRAASRHAHQMLERAELTLKLDVEKQKLRDLVARNFKGGPVGGQTISGRSMPS